MIKPQLISSETIYEGKIISLTSEVIDFNGIIMQRDCVKHPGAVLIVAKADDGSFLLVKQYRHAIQNFCTEFPAGTLEPNETPLDCAKRELQEETGFGAHKWINLGYLQTTPGFSNETIYGFAASDLFPSKLPEDDEEDLELIFLSRNELENFIGNGNINDSKTISFFFKYLLSSSGLETAL